MNSCTVPSCGRTLRHDEAHRAACGGCEHRIRGWLRELTLQLPLLQASLQTDRGPAQGSIHSGRAHSPLPVREDVLTLIGPAAPHAVHDPHRDQAGPAPITATLTSWTQLITEERHLLGPAGRPTVEQLSQWLAAHLGWAVQQLWIAELHQELRELIHRVRGITRTEPRRRGLDASCPHCAKFGLIEEDWSEWIECTDCGLLLSHAEYDDHARRTLPPLYRTALLIAAQHHQDQQEQARP